MSLIDTSLTFWVDNNDSVLVTPDQVRDSSYRQVLDSGIVSKQAGQIFQYLLNYPEGKSNNDINRALGIRVSSVTARINELRKQERVFMVGKAIDYETGKLNVLWGAK